MYSQPSKNGNTLSSRIINDICSNSRMTLPDLCVRSKISRKHCPHILILPLGVGFRKIRGICRLCHSVRIISSGQEIKKCAYNCGYKHVQNFNRAFKKHFGEPPSRYKYVRARPKLRSKLSCPLHRRVQGPINNQTTFEMKDLVSG